MHIGVLEDDSDQQAVLHHWLQGAGHSCKGFGTVREMLAALPRESFDLLLLDWVLPDGSGIDVIHWVRQRLGWHLAIVVLTAQEAETEVVRALEAGADDYVVKPAKQQELLTRLQAVTRRMRPEAVQVLRMGAYEVDLHKHQLLLQGEAVPLTQKEFDLAVYMFQNPAKLMSRDHLLNKIWGLNTEVDTRTVDTHVSRLRKKLDLGGRHGWKLSPVYGYGYRLDRV